jgi:hypothetical protein
LKWRSNLPLWWRTKKDEGEDEAWDLTYHFENK